MSQYEYPNTRKAAKAAKGAEWSLAEALLTDIGVRGTPAAFRDCAEYLAGFGFDYAPQYLADLHAAARDFPAEARHPWLTPNNARMAGSPEIVEAAIEIKKSKADELGIDYVPPSQREMTAARRTVSHHARARSGGGRAAPTPQARSSSAKAPVSELRRAANVLALSVLAGDAAKAGRTFISDIAGHELDDVERDALIEDVQQVLDTWKIALSAVRNPLAQQVERFLSEGV